MRAVERSQYTDSHIMPRKYYRIVSLQDAVRRARIVAGYRIQPFFPLITGLAGYSGFAAKRFDIGVRGEPFLFEKASGPDDDSHLFRG